jgi:ABC-type multidrug transport system ATPase subunit
MVLRIENLCKTWPGGKRALDQVSLSISPGLYGLLGPNGAGKSTLMRTIATLQDPDSGSVHFDGIDVIRQKSCIRSLLGYLPQEFGVYPRTSAFALLDHIAMLKGCTDSRARRESVNAMLCHVNLYQFRSHAVETFSGGMKRRFGIAQALLGNPRLLIIDEPTAGLDPGERNRFCDLLYSTAQQAVVILSTHIIQDVQQLCPCMAIIHEGRVLYSGSTSAAIDSLQGKIWKKLVPMDALPNYQSRFQVISTRLMPGSTQICIFADAQPDTGFESCDPDLESFFFSRIPQTA